MQKQSITIALDRERHLRYDYNAFCLIEEKLGADCMTAEFWDSVTPVKLRAVLWAGLVWEDVKLTLEAAGDLITLDRLAEIQTAILKSYQAAFPTRADDGSSQT